MQTCLAALVCVLLATACASYRRDVIPAEVVASSIGIAADDQIADASVTVEITTGNGAGMCNGVYIAPTLVLTAAHCCLTAGFGEPEIKYSVTAAPFWRHTVLAADDAKSVVSVPAYSCTKHEKYSNKDPKDGYDVAVLHLVHPLPLPFRPIEILPLAYEIKLPERELNPEQLPSFGTGGEPVVFGFYVPSTRYEEVHESFLSVIPSTLHSEDPTIHQLHIGPLPMSVVYRGNSGGGVYYRIGHKAYLLGIATSLYMYTGIVMAHDVRWTNRWLSVIYATPPKLPKAAVRSQRSL